MSDRARDRLALGAWMTFLAGALAALQALGSGPLEAPPTNGIGRWFAERDAATAVFALLRLALLGTGWYLFAATLLAAALRLVRADVAAGAVEACTPAPVRRLVRAAAGLTLAASVVAVSAAAASEGDEPVTMRRLPETGTPVADDADGPVTMIRLADEPAQTAPPASPPPTPATWTVVPGDHLWSIAERSLEAAWRRSPSDDEIDPYWRLLIEQNRTRIPDPANPDLIHPALELVLPAPPPAPAR